MLEWLYFPAALAGVPCPTNPATCSHSHPLRPPSPTPTRRRSAPPYALAAVVHAGVCLPGGHSHDTDQPRRAQRPAAHRAGRLRELCALSDCSCRPDCPAATCCFSCACLCALTIHPACHDTEAQCSPALPPVLLRRRAVRPWWRPTSPSSSSRGCRWCRWVGEGAMCNRCHPSCPVEDKQACLPACSLSSAHPPPHL